MNMKTNLVGARVVPVVKLNEYPEANGQECVVRAVVYDSKRLDGPPVPYLSVQLPDGRLTGLYSCKVFKVVA